MTYFNKSTPRGVGKCGDPSCTEPKAEGRHMCAEHAVEMDRIRKEMEENPASLYNQRAASGRKRQRPPTCSQPGCYEIRVPPAPFCDEHERAA